MILRSGPGPRGVVVVLCALMMAILLGMVAFAVDIGYLAVARTELQAAVDGAALAGVAELNQGQAYARQKAKDLAALHKSANATVSLQDSDIQFGNYNRSNNAFTANASPINAVRVATTRSNIGLFFGGVLGKDKGDVTAEAIAMLKARDIAFVVDLSGSMNNDTEIWATAAINAANSPDYPTIGSTLMQQVFTDFGFGSFPGTYQSPGAAPPSGSPGSAPPGGYVSSASNQNLAYLRDNTSSPVRNSSLPAAIRIVSTDSTSTRKTKVYRWLMEYQLKRIMPNATPAPDYTTNYNYWAVYLDYVLEQSSYKITGASNPYDDAWPSLTSSCITPYASKLGYATYVQFMMDYGRNKNVTGSTKVPLSISSSLCPWNTETDPSSAGYGYTFPPREQPTHACRVAIMAAINKIADLNAGVPDEIKDHVCVISFDVASGVNIRYPLSATSCDYEAAKVSCRDMQAVADDTASTASENGLIAAKNHLDPAVNPNARAAADKVLVFLSDGIPNIKQSSNATISSYMTSYDSNHSPAGEWFSGGSYSYERNAVLMQAATYKDLGWKTHAVGIGLGADLQLMDRIARMAGTGIQDPANPSGPKISPYAEGNPADYQQRLTSIFEGIVATANVKLVK